MCPSVLLDPTSWTLYVLHHSVPLEWSSTILHIHCSVYGNHYPICESKMVSIGDMNSPTHFSTPSLNFNFYINSFFCCTFRHLDVAGLKDSKLYIYNGVALFFGWLVGLSNFIQIHITRRLFLVYKEGHLANDQS